jgi:uncharacterized protein YerC
MGFLSRFRQKKEAEVVSPKEARERVDSEIEIRKDRLREEGTQIIVQIKEIRERLRAQFTKLESKKVPVALPSNTAGIVRKLKSVLIRKVVQELDSLKNTSPTYGFFEKFLQVKKEILRWSVKNRAAMIVVDKELARDIGKSLKEFEDIGGKVETLLNECNVKKLEECKQEITRALENITLGMKTEEETKNRIEVLKKMIKNLEDELTELESGEEKGAYLKKKEEKEGSEEELRRILASLNNQLSLLGRPLRKFSRICTVDEIEKMVQEYASDPVDTILKDGSEYPYLKKILEKLSPMVSSGELGLKDRVKEKVIEQLRSILSGSLEKEVSNALELRAKAEEGINSGILGRIESKKREVESLKEELKEQGSIGEVGEPNWEEIGKKLQEVGINVRLIGQSQGL